MPTAILLFLLGTAARLINFLDIFPGGGRAYLFEPDCYMRLRKVMVYLAAFPRPLVFDYFQGYPQGTGIISAPLMEYLLAALLFPFTGREIDEHLLTVVMAFIPPLAGGLTVALLFLLVREWLGTTSAIVAAAFLALLPVHMESTMLGRFDNEMIEPLMFVVSLRLYLRTYRDDAPGNWLRLGIAQALFVILWRGALVPLGVIGVDILLRAYRPGERGRFSPHAASCYLLPAALFALVCLTDIWGTRASFSYNIVSWFHVLLFGLAAGVVSAAGYLASAKRSVRLLAFGVMASVCLALFPFLKPGLMVAAGGNEWIDSISQYLPAYRDGSTVYLYGIFPIVAPVAALLWLRKNERSDLPRRFLLLSLVFCYLLALLRGRFGHFYAVEAAIAAGFVPLLLRERFAGRFASPLIASSLSLAALLPLQLPTLVLFPSLSSQTTGPLKGDLEQTFLWLRKETPPAGDPYRPDRLPAYSVLTHWDLGGYLETIGQRPSVATSYGMETYGLEEAGRLFLSTDSAGLTRVLDRNRSRYMILYNPLDKLEMYTRLLKVENRFFVDKWDEARKRYAFVPTAEALDLAVLRLYIADGSMVSLGKLTFQPIEGVRLVYESGSPAELGGFPWEVRQSKVFERVAGARVVVPPAGGCTVIAEQTVVTNQGREFIYRNLGRADVAGGLSVVLPYPPKLGEATGAVGPAIISCGGRRATAEISAAAVASGKTMPLSW